MDRRYYLLKIGILLAALVVAGATGGTGPAKTIHDMNRTRYSAPAAIETAAWCMTIRFSGFMARLLGTGASVQR